MFQRSNLTRITLAVALLSAAVITLPAQAGLLGGGASRGMSGSLAGAGSGMGSLGARSLELNGQGAGRADAEVSRPAIGRPLRDTMARGQERASGGISGISDAQERASGRPTGQAEGSAALAVDRASGGIGRAEGSGASSAGAAGALLTAPSMAAHSAPALKPAADGAGTQPVSSSIANNASASNTSGSGSATAGGTQSASGAPRTGRADAGADTSGQAQASRNGNRVEASGSASTSAQASAQR